MFNTSNGYSLADIAAATGGNGYRNGDDGMWGNGAWWIIILFLFCFNGWAEMAGVMAPMVPAIRELRQEKN